MGSKISYRGGSAAFLLGTSNRGQDNNGATIVVAAAAIVAGIRADPRTPFAARGSAGGSSLFSIGTV